LNCGAAFVILLQMRVHLRCGKIGQFVGSVTQKLYNTEKLAKKGHLLVCPLADRMNTEQSPKTYPVHYSVHIKEHSHPIFAILGWSNPWKEKFQYSAYIRYSPVANTDLHDHSRFGENWWRGSD